MWLEDLDFQVFCIQFLQKLRESRLDKLVAAGLLTSHQPVFLSSYLIIGLCLYSRATLPKWRQERKKKKFHKNVRFFIVEVGRELCLPAQTYNQFQFQIHQTAIFKGYSDQKTGTACLNFFKVVTVGCQKVPYITNLYCPT